MSQFRVAQVSSILTMNSSVQYNRFRYEQKIEQISTGKKYLNRSDDPSATDEIARIKNENTKTGQWEQNVDLVTSWEKANEARTSSILSSVHRARELAVEANNGGLSPQDRINIAKEVDGLLEALIQDSNTSYVGTPIFSGKGLLPPNPVEWEEISQSTKPTFGDVDLAVPAGGDWDTMTEAEFDNWLDNTAGSYTSNPPLSSPPTTAQKSTFKAQFWNSGVRSATVWADVSTDAKPNNPIPPLDAYMPSDHDWADLTKTEYDAWKTENPNATDPGWYDAPGPPATGHTRQWPAPIEPKPNADTAGPYNPNIGMPTGFNAPGWEELSPEEYMDWREAQEQAAGAADFYDPGWDAVNKKPKPWPQPSREPDAGMHGMPSGNTWENLTEDEFEKWLTLTGSNNNPAGYTWDGTSNPSGIEPVSDTDLFRETFFSVPNGKTFTSLYEDPTDPEKVTGVRYNGSPDQRDAQFAEGSTVVKYGMLGSGPEGLFIVTGENPGDPDELNVFDALINLRDALETGDTPPDQFLTEIEEIDNHVVSKVVESTVNQKKLEGMKKIINVSETSQVNRLSDVEDLDVALAYSQMTAMQSAFEASLQMVQRVNSMQLLDYI